MEIEDEAWFLDTSKMLMKSDIFAAKSWLLTAKSIFPQSFQLQMEEYLLGLSRKNIEECSKVLNDIFREFPNEGIVWDEIEKLIQSIEHSNDSLRKAIFDGLPALTQQRMLLVSAESKVNIAQYCRLLIVLMKKFPEVVSQYGMTLTDRLVEAEKKDPEGTPVNHYRKLLVCDVLPVICHIGNLNVSLKHFYKWLQKATEFYVCFYTSENEINVSNAWTDMEKLRTDIALQCSWNEEKASNRSSTLVDRMAFMKELFRRSRTDVDGAVNRKQIFYTTLILLFEASSIYMENLSSSIYRDAGKEENSLVLMLDIDDSTTANDDTLEHLPPRKATMINDAFQVAKDSWNILHAVETFEKDFNHLLRRWKCERWTWFQLFLVDLNIHNGNLQLAVKILTQIEQQFDKESIRPEIKVRTYSSLVFACFSLGFYKKSCEFLFTCLSLLSLDELTASSGDHVTGLSTPPTVLKLASPFQSSVTANHPLLVVRPIIRQLLPLWITILIRSLEKTAPKEIDDSILSHVMVLSQHRWPCWRSQCNKVFEIIEEKQSFTFELFLQFVINVDILEEVAFLKSKRSCQITISKHASKTHVTRGANREADDEFWKAIKANIQRSAENVDILLANYLTTNKHSLLTALDKIGQNG